MAHADVLQHDVLGRRRGAKMLVHHRGAAEQLLDIEP